MVKKIAKDITIAGVVGFVLTKLLRRRHEHERAHAPKRFVERIIPF